MQPEARNGQSLWRPYEEELTHGRRRACEPGIALARRLHGRSQLRSRLATYEPVQHPPIWCDELDCRKPRNSVVTADRRLAIRVDQDANKPVGQRADRVVGEGGCFHLVAISTPLGREKQQTGQTVPGGGLAPHSRVAHEVQFAMTLDQIGSHLAKGDRDGVTPTAAAPQQS